MLSTSVSVVLLVWLLARWWQIARKVRCAANSPRLTAIACEAQKFLGLKSKVQVRLAKNPMSPAVCGLFRPAILIPQSLAENFSDKQLRAVLLHELIHLRRRDVWMNFAQALLQIFYWWHPLVWLANARIRRVREEAVDDAVMLALRDEAESYALTLLEVAKLALNRPLASLGLVGILESRHALRQRIERLVDFRPPLKAGLTLVSLLGILAFTAVAVPMGGAPTQTNNPASPGVTAIVDVIENLNQTNSSISAAANLSNNTNTVHDWITVTFKINNPIGEEQLKKLFQDAGVEMPPTVYFYTDNGILLVRGPKEQVALVHHIVLKLNGFPQKDIEATDKQFISQWSATAAEDSTNLFERTFKVDALVFTSALQKTMGLQTANVSTMARNFFSKMGVDFDLPGKSIVFNDKLGLLFVRATDPDLDTIERILQVLNQVAPQNHPVATNSIEQKTNASQLVQDGKLLYEKGKLDEAQAKLDEALKLDPDSEAAFYYKNLIRQARLIYTGPGRTEIMNKLNSYRLSVSYDPAVPLREVIRDLRQKIQAVDPTKKPMNININNSPLGGATQIDPNTGLPLAPNPATGGVGGEAVDIGSYLIKLNLKDVRLADVLDAICMVANDLNHPDERIKYSTMDYGVVFSLKDQSPALFERTFKVGPNVFFKSLRGQTGLQTTNDSTMARNYFSKLGVDMESPAGKSVVYNDRLGLLFVRATNPDLDMIEHAIQALNQVKPQIHIKARFVEVPAKGFFDPAILTNNPYGGLTGILTSEQAQTVLRMLEAKPGVEELAEPEATTTSGRQTQMGATQNYSAKIFTTNIILQQTWVTNHGNVMENTSIVPQATQLKVGPVLDVIPYVLSDGYTINLTLIPSLTQILVGSNSVPEMLPDFRIRHVVSTLNLRDGQTAIIGGLPEKDYVNGKEVFDKSKSSDKELLVFITVTLVDPAGNRLHSDGDMPFAKNGIPAQPKH